MDAEFSKPGIAGLVHRFPKIGDRTGSAIKAETDLYPFPIEGARKGAGIDWKLRRRGTFRRNRKVISDRGRFPPLPSFSLLDSWKRQAAGSAAVFSLRSYFPYQIGEFFSTYFLSFCHTVIGRRKILNRCPNSSLNCAYTHGELIREITSLPHPDFKN